ncbi:MAG: TlpA disulfide reductase family protein, partial [Chitinophagaceae bacterium]
QVKNNYTIHGKWQQDGKMPSCVYLHYLYNKKQFLDSARIVNGMYTFQGSVADVVFGWLALTPDPYGITDTNAIAIFIDRASMQVISEGPFVQAVISGSFAHEEYKKVMTVLRPYYDRRKQLWHDRQAALSAGQSTGEKEEQKIKQQYTAFVEEVNDSIRNGQLAFVKGNPASPIALYLIREAMGIDFNGDLFAGVFAMLPAAVRNSEEGKTIGDRIEVVRRVSVGHPAIDFAQADTAGNRISLSSFRGRYVLLEFWASWCKPCREENPMIVAAFHRFRDRGFTVLGVSLDTDTDKWIRAIHADSLDWTHVCEGGKRNPVARLYGIYGIPQNFLINPEGVIIAKGLSGDQLLEELARIFP